MKKIIKNILSKIFDFIGYEIVLYSKKHKHIIRNNYGLNLNIGSGDYHLTDFISLDLDSERYHKNDKDKYISYDIRKDLLPFSNSEVDNIYISHVVEHIENNFVQNLFNECYRVLKKGGVLRIATPDAEFLYEVSSFDNSYWTWRKHWFENPENISENFDVNSLSQMDYFIKMIATPRSPYYRNKIVNEDKNLEYEKNSYEDIVNSLTNNLSFRYKFPGDHINYWDFNKVKIFGKNSGFTNIIKSKYLGSVSEIMRRSEFDKKAVMMSLYVDLVK